MQSKKFLVDLRKFSQNSHDKSYVHDTIHYLVNPPFDNIIGVRTMVLIVFAQANFNRTMDLIVIVHEDLVWL